MVARMKVSEIFKSIQGEGLYMGVPTLFVRMYGCNLACPWCDTKYALSGDFKARCYRELIADIYSVARPPIVVCFTGGEPMIQQRLLDQTIKLLKTRGYDIHIETNGTIPPRKGLIRDVDFWTISPKLHEDFSKSFVKSKVSYLGSVKRLCQLDTPKQLKFVVAKKEETRYILDFVDSLMLTADQRKSLPIVIQPERYSFSQSKTSFGDERDVYLDNMPELVGWCEESLQSLNWRVLPQLHYLLYKGIRGV